MKAAKVKFAGSGGRSEGSLCVLVICAGGAKGEGKD